MLSEFGEMALEHPVEYANAADRLRARCFFGSLVGTQDICVDQMTDLLEAALIKVVEDGWGQGAISEAEVETHLAAALYVSQCGPVLEPMFGVDTIEAVGEEAAPTPVCSDQITPNPEFVSFLVEKLYDAIRRLNPQFELYRVAVAIAFASFTSWMTDATGRGYYSRDEGLSIIERVQAKLETLQGRGRNASSSVH